MNIAEFLSGVFPWNRLPEAELATVAAAVKELNIASGEEIYRVGDTLKGLYFIRSGEVEITDANDGVLSSLGPRSAFGERGLIRDGIAVTNARSVTPTQLFLIPAQHFLALIDNNTNLNDFYARSRATRAARRSLTHTPVAALMSTDLKVIAPDTTLTDAAMLMRDFGISSVLVVEDGTLHGILTIRDVARVLAERLDPDTSVSHVMTVDPVTLPPDAIGSDVLHLIMERGIGHVPIVGDAGLLGIITKTDLTRFQAESSAEIIGDAAHAPDSDALAAITRRIPQLLAQLVGEGNRHDVTTRLVTDIADAVTRRLLTLAQVKLGPAPAPYLWLACGSQGRREQTGVSDQDNVLILSDAATEDDDAYFAEFARFVSDGLDRCGYVFCPGDMMATNPRWRQPLRVWRKYFKGWIAHPDKEAQMLASVMFDLRPIGGDLDLYAGLQTETLEAASRNSIFVAHMISNSLGHAPPLGLWRGFATMRSGEHRDHIDLKLNGVVPIVDLGRIYALRGRLSAVNTRARIEGAQAAGIISQSGGRDLLDAYDLIAQTRLEHQMKQVRRGEAPDNFMAPTTLGDFERSHLRNAFVVVRTMQSAAAQGRALP